MCIISTSIVAGVLGSVFGATLATNATAVAATTIAAVANTAIGAGVAASVAMPTITSIQQGKAQQAQYEYQAKVAQENAKIAQNNANIQRQQGIEEARLQRMKTIQKVGSQQAAMAANGIDIAQGTALDVIDDTAAMGELDALSTRYNYETKALAYEQQAGNYNNQANLDIISGQNAYNSGVYRGISEGIGGLTKTADIAGKWLGYSGFGAGSGAGLNL